MFCCCKKKTSKMGDLEQLKDLEIVKKVKESTSFTWEEIERFYISYSNHSQDGALRRPGFKKLMELMSIRMSTKIEDRIFNVIDSNKQGKLDFLEIMKYFNTILKGNKSEKMCFCHYLLDGSHKGYFTREDLSKLLYDLNTSDMKNSKHSDEDLKKEYNNVAESIMEEMGVDFDHKVHLDEFLEILDKYEPLYQLFREMGSNITSLMDNQGQNQFTIIISALKELFTKYNIEMQKSRTILDQELSICG